MKVMIVDDEKLALNNLKKILGEVQPGVEIVTFLYSKEAFEYLSVNPVDIAFLDIEMGGLSGIELAEKCKQYCASVNIIFVTGYSRYSLDALKLHASGFLLKPVRADDLLVELENLRYPLPQICKKVRIQTFGYFEVYVDEIPLKFPRQKCKECLAYLVDRRGAGVTHAQLSAVLWEDEPYSRAIQNYTHKIISDLVKALKQVGADDIIRRRHMDIAIDMGKVNCDYFSAVSGEMGWMNTFTGEYMTNYSWAEFTLGELMEIKERNSK